MSRYYVNHDEWYPVAGLVEAPDPPLNQGERALEPTVELTDEEHAAWKAASAAMHHWNEEILNRYEAAWGAVEAKK